MNVGVGFAISTLYESSSFSSIVLYLALFLVGVNAIKIAFSMLHMVMSWIDRCRVNSLIKTKTSNVFKNIADEEAGKEKDVFVVYYEGINADSNIRISATDDPEYLKSSIRGSVNDDQVYRGFDRKEILRKQRIADGSHKSKLSQCIIERIL